MNTNFSRPTKLLSLGQIIVLQAYWLGLSFMWNSLHVIILPAILLTMVPENLKNTYLGLLTFTGLIVAMVIQPTSGALSDRWASSWGRRRPLISLGTAFDFIFLIFLAWSGGLVWLALGYIGLQFSSNIAHGPMQGLMPDKVSLEQLGLASGIKNFMDMAGLVLASLLMGQIYPPDTQHPVVPIMVVAIVLAFSALITIFGVHELPYRPKNTISPIKSLRQEFRIDWTNNGNFAWLILSRLFFLIAIYGIQVFAQYYVRDVLEVENPIRLTGNLLAAITLALVAFTLIGGWLGDRIGHKKVSYLASLIGGSGCFFMLWARTPETLLLFGGLFGIGIGLFLTANWALANSLAPTEEAGKFLGLTNLATAGAGAISRLEGPFIDLLNNANSGAWWGYSGLFLVGVFSILISVILLKNVKVTEEKMTHEIVISS
jgi:MFS family permease